MDDELDARELLSVILRSFGAEVQAASSAETALLAESSASGRMCS